MKTYIGAWAGALACTFAGLLGTCIVSKTPLRRAVRTTWIMFWAVLIWTAKHLGTAFGHLAAELLKKMAGIASQNIILKHSRPGRQKQTQRPNGPRNPSRDKGRRTMGRRGDR